MISKIIFWNIFTCKGTYMIDWVGRLSAKIFPVKLKEKKRCISWDKKIWGCLKLKKKGCLKSKPSKNGSHIPRAVLGVLAAWQQNIEKGKNVMNHSASMFWCTPCTRQRLLSTKCMHNIAWHKIAPIPHSQKLYTLHVAWVLLYLFIFSIPIFGKGMLQRASSPILAMLLFQWFCSRFCLCFFPDFLLFFPHLTGFWAILVVSILVRCFRILRIFVFSRFWEFLVLVACCEFSVFENFPVHDIDVLKGIRPRMDQSHSDQPRTGWFPIFSIGW